MAKAAAATTVTDMTTATERTEASAMNLKAFHIFFITCSALMCFGAAVLYGAAWQTGGDSSAMVPTGAWTIGGVLLVYYGVYFLRKFKDWGYL